MPHSILNSLRGCWRSAATAAWGSVSIETDGKCLCYSVIGSALHLQFSHSVMSNSLQPHGLQNSRPPCPSPTPGVCSNSCPLSRWCHPTISSFFIPFSSCLQSFPASESFPMSQFFISGGQSIGSFSFSIILSMNIQDGFPLGWTGWISLQSKGFSQE